MIIPIRLAIAAVTVNSNDILEIIFSARINNKPEVTSKNIVPIEN